MVTSNLKRFLLLTMVPLAEALGADADPVDIVRRSLSVENENAKRARNYTFLQRDEHRQLDGNLRFRHWGSLAGRKAVLEHRDLRKREKKIPWAFTSGGIASSGGCGARLASPGTEGGSGPSNGMPLHWSAASGRQGMNVGVVSGYGERAVSSREYWSRSMRLNFCRNLPRTGSAMSSRILPNSASVSRQNRCR